MSESAAIGLYQRAVTLNPLRAANAGTQANIFYNIGRLDQAIAMGKTALTAIPVYPGVQP